MTRLQSRPIRIQVWFLTIWIVSEVSPQAFLESGKFEFVVQFLRPFHDGARFDRDLHFDASLRIDLRPDLTVGIEGFVGYRVPARMLPLVDVSGLLESRLPDIPCSPLREVNYRL